MSESKESGRERRRARRWLINESVELTIGDQSHDYRIMDISETGARVLTDLDLEEGRQVVLELPGRLMLPATVIHVMENAVGVEFRVGPAARSRLGAWIEAVARATTDK